MATSRGSIEALFRSPGGTGKTVDLAKWASDFRVKIVFAADTRGVGDDVSAVTLSVKGQNACTRKVAERGSLNRRGLGAMQTSRRPGRVAGTLHRCPPATGSLPACRHWRRLTSSRARPPQQMKDLGLNPATLTRVRVEITEQGWRDNGRLYRQEGYRLPAPAAPECRHRRAKVWVRVEGQPGAIRASGSVNDLTGLAAIIENPDPLRDRTLLAIDRPRIDGIDISTGVKLRKAGTPPSGSSTARPTPAEPQSTSVPSVNRLLDVLTERRTIRSFPAGNDANFTPGYIQAEVKIWADGFEPQADPKAEPKAKDKVQPITLIFGKPEGDSIYVRRIMPGGGKTDFLLPDKIKVGIAAEPIDLLAAIKKSRLELLDSTLKTFSPEVVNKLEVSGVANFTLVREEKKDPSTGSEKWTFAAPADKKGQTADAGTVAEMLRILGTTQSVTKFVNKAPDEAALIDYRLPSTESAGDTAGPGAPTQGDRQPQGCAAGRQHANLRVR